MSIFLFTYYIVKARERRTKYGAFNIYVVRNSEELSGKLNVIGGFAFGCRGRTPVPVFGIQNRDSRRSSVGKAMILSCVQSLERWGRANMPSSEVMNPEKPWLQKSKKPASAGGFLI